MKQTTNYLILFACLLYLKLIDKNKDTIKILVSLVILYFVYKLFKRDKTEVENFLGSCSPPSSIPSPCARSCPSDTASPCCTQQSGGTASLCVCEESKGWHMVQGSDQGDSVVGTCYCDPEHPDSTDKCEEVYTCGEWTSLATTWPTTGANPIVAPGCPTGTGPIPENSPSPMTASPQQFCCTSPHDPCSSNPCGLYSTCMTAGDSHTCPCDAGYHKVAGTCVQVPASASPHPCSSNPCGDNGTCSVDAATNVAKCNCDYGWGGDICKDTTLGWYVLAAIILVLVLLLTYLWWRRRRGLVERVANPMGLTGSE
jgi:hypothetical protein